MWELRKENEVWGREQGLREQEGLGMEYKLTGGVGKRMGLQLWMWGEQGKGESVRKRLRLRRERARDM